MQLTIPLDKNDFTRMKSFILQNKRATLNADFSDFISEKIQIISDIKCWLKNNFNYVSPKLNKHSNVKKIWSGNYKCIDSACGIVYKMNIKSNSCFTSAEAGHLFVVYENISNHQTIKKELRCHGIKRDNQKIILEIEGVTNTLSSNIIENKNKG